GPGAAHLLSPFLGLGGRALAVPPLGAATFWPRILAATSGLALTLVPVVGWMNSTCCFCLLMGALLWAGWGEGAAGQAGPPTAPPPAVATRGAIPGRHA